MEARRGVLYILYIVRASGRRGRETLAFPMGCCPRTVDGSGFFSIRKEFWVSVRPKAQGRIAHAACRAEWYVSGSAPSEINLGRAKDRISKLAEAEEGTGRTMATRRSRWTSRKRSGGITLPGEVEARRAPDQRLRSHRRGGGVTNASVP